MRESWWMRCRRLAKPGVGVVHVHCARWRPGKVAQMWFQPAQREIVYPVPEAAWEDLLAAESLVQAMAAVRTDA